MVKLGNKLNKQMRKKHLSKSDIFSKDTTYQKDTYSSSGIFLNFCYCKSVNFFLHCTKHVSMDQVNSQYDNVNCLVD